MKWIKIIVGLTFIGLNIYLASNLEWLALGMLWAGSFLTALNINCEE